MRLASIFVAVLVTAAAATATAGASSAWHEDDSYGYAIKPPAKWEQIPIRAGEDWLVAKYLSDRTYYWTDDTEGRTREHRPEMMVVAFIDDELRKQLNEGASDGDDSPIKIKTKPYKDYEDYLDRTYSGGGFYIDGKEEDEIKGVKVTQYSIKVEKLSYSGPKRIITWIYHTDKIDLAVQFEVFESEYKKLKRMLSNSLKSFKVIPRTLSGLTGEASTLSFYISIESMREGTPEERKIKRMQSQQQLHDQAVSGLADGWSHEYQGNFLVLNHTDPRYAQRLVDHGDAIIAWLEENFPYVGPEEYVRTPILRVCDNDEEERSFSRGRSAGSSWGWYGGGLEIVTHKDDSGFQTGWETDQVNRRILTHWFRERDATLYFAMPDWLQFGLSEYIENARAERRKIDFRPDDWEREKLRELIRADQAKSPRELMGMTGVDFGEGDVWGHMNEGAALVRFLLSPAARKSKATKTLLKDYIVALDEVLEEIEKEDDGKEKAEKPTNEEEEEAYYKERNERWKEREQEIIDRTFKRVFGSWKDRDWKRLEKAYFKEVS